MNERDTEPTITIASCLKAPRKGETFLSWPHHLTLVPPFQATPWDLHDISVQVANIADMTKPVAITGGDQTQFEGVDDDIRLIANAPDLLPLHTQLLHAIRKNGGHLLDDSFVGEGAYTPHITRKEKAGPNDPWLEHGENVVLPGLDIVRRDPGNNVKTVIGHYAFRGWTSFG